VHVLVLTIEWPYYVRGTNAIMNREPSLLIKLSSAFLSKLFDLVGFP